MLTVFPVFALEDHPFPTTTPDLEVIYSHSGKGFMPALCRSKNATF